MARVPRCGCGDAIRDHRSYGDHGCNACLCTGFMPFARLDMTRKRGIPMMRRIIRLQARGARQRTLIRLYRCLNGTA